MARIIVTTLASADQAAILNHLHAKAGLGTVIKFRSLFGALYDRLADHPASGPRRTALGSNIRIGIVNEQSRIRDRLRQTSARLKTMARVNRALYLNPRDAVEYLRSPRRLDARLERFFSMRRGLRRDREAFA